jgi:hypothetical protein
VKKPFAAACICAVLFCSCVAVSSTIKLRPDGSGTIALEYRVAKNLEELGAFDGNERWLPVPVGRADMERSIRRIPGMKLVSFSRKEAGNDAVYSLRLDFDSPGALAAFLDASGRGISIDMKNRRFALTFEKGEEMELARQFLSGYDFSLSFSPSGETADMRWLDENGAEIQGPGEFSTRRPELTFRAAMADIVFPDRTLIMEISW